MDAIFYLVRTGCHWRALPREYPPWSMVHYWFRRWRLDGTWERLNGAPRDQLRARVGRDPQPSAAIVDSQSVKTTGVGAVRGYDGAKKLSGRKRHLLVDTLRWVLKAKVHTAELQDRAAVPPLPDGVTDLFPRVAHAWMDQGHTGTGKIWIEEHLGWTSADRRSRLSASPLRAERTSHTVSKCSRNTNRAWRCTRVPFTERAVLDRA